MEITMKIFAVMALLTIATLTQDRAERLGLGDFSFPKEKLEQIETNLQNTLESGSLNCSPLRLRLHGILKRAFRDTI